MALPCGTAPPRRRYSEGEVKEIVKRASEMEASNPTLVEEIRRVLGIVGQVSQLGRSFFWSGTRGQRRDLEVAVSVRGGRTRVIVQENLANLIGGGVGGIGGGMGGGGLGPIAAIFGGGMVRHRSRWR